MGTQRQAHDDPVETLQTLLQTASTLVRSLSGDPEFLRLVSAFERIPSQDRSVILGVLEREVEMRRTVGGAPADLTGLQVLKPNPNARLYVRVFQKAATELPGDHDDLVLSTLQTARVLTLVLAPSMFARWRAAALEAFTLLEPEELDAARRVFDELVLIGDEAAARQSRESG